MGKRIKTIVLLCVVLSLIYIQHSEIIYAENSSEGQAECEDSENIEEKEPEESEEGEKEAEKSEVEEGEKESEKPEVEEGEKEPEKPIIKVFSVGIPKADGRSEFYTVKPNIQITHNSEYGITKYRLKKGEQLLVQGSIKEKDRRMEIPGERLGDGEYGLTVWMEDDMGKRIEKTTMRKTLRIDTQEPEIQMYVQGGFDIWHKGAVTLNVKGVDTYSGVRKLACYVNGAYVGEVKGGKGSFEITESSVLGNGVEVIVAAEDYAGNESSRVKSLYIDNTVPVVEIVGAKEYMITSNPLYVTYKVQDENLLGEFSASAVREDEHGKQSLCAVSDWQEIKGGRKTVQKLTENGIYQLSISAVDKSGQKTDKSLQVIIDRENPVIRGVEEMNGKYLQSFCWDVPKEEVIWDFTTYTYEILLNGKPYHMGKEITVEGNHMLEVKARDAAGNEAKAQARFTIDHTPPEIRIMDVEEGKEYEEKCTIQVGLGNAEDTIQRVQINGEEQKIDSGGQTYRCTLQEHQDYEIKVTAVDRAGNQAEKSIMFSVVPKKTLIQRIAEPVIKTFTGTVTSNENIDGTDREEEKKRVEKTLPVKKMVITVAVILFVLAAVGCYFSREHIEKEEEE